MPWRSIHNGRQRNITPWLYLHYPLDSNWQLTLATAHQVNKFPLLISGLKRPGAPASQPALDDVEIDRLAEAMLISRPGKPRYNKNGSTLPWRALRYGRQQNKPPRQGPTPPPLLSFFFSRRASGISTYIPFPLTHNVLCAIENPGAQISRPVRPDSFQHKVALTSPIGDQP